MEPPKDFNPLSEVMSEMGNPEARREERFEEKCVRYVLGEFGMAGHRHKLADRQFRLNGHKGLSFFQFSEEFGDFPVYLAATKIPYIVKDCTIENLFNRFRTRRFVKRYEELADTIPEEHQHKPFGMIVAWPKLNRGLILHDAVVNMNDNGFRMFWKHGKKSLCIEPFKKFIEAMQWDPVVD